MGPMEEVLKHPVLLSELLHGRGYHPKDAILRAQDGNIQDFFPLVEYEDVYLLLLIETVGDGSSHRLREDPDFGGNLVLEI